MAETPQVTENHIAKRRRLFEFFCGMVSWI